MTQDLNTPTSYRRLWIGLAVVLVVTFAILGFTGTEIYRQAPPLPGRVVADDGSLLMTRDGILDGQQSWQSTGGQQIGSIWGHGAYQAPDWTADWLHRECLVLLDIWAERDFGQAYDNLTDLQQASLEHRLVTEMRTNRYDQERDELVLSADRVLAIKQVAAHYRALFSDDPELAGLREAYAMQDNVLKSEERLERLTDFIFWTAWSAATERPGQAVTYTNNWPHEPLINNKPSSANILWSILSVIVLLAGIGGLVWWKAFRDRHEGELKAPARDPLLGIEITPSMRGVMKYFYVVIALFVVQVSLGAVIAHYTVEGQAFYGIPLAKWLPYSLARTWHIQTALFWIATSFLGAGLFLAPIIGGHEPKHQKLGVNLLFGALLLVVTGSLAGEAFSIHQKLSLNVGFWFGHQGYEYVDLGRFWQILLIVGVLLWLFLMFRAMWPALQRGRDNRSLKFLFAGATFAIGLFYMAGLFYGARTHLSVAEYWRWWVVHLWVEGFFEVFATAAIAFLFATLGLVKFKSATQASLFSTSIFLVSGIPGTAHHLYFSGSPLSVMAIGASFSALEVVPLVLVGFEAFETLRSGRMATWVERYRWPIKFFVGVAFWNLVGAGLFGFLINPPIALYYMQGLNTTPVHGHTALFGVYGLLSLGLLLVVVRRLTGERPWRETPLRIAFWSLNIGLSLMVLLSLLPVGLLQTYASIEHGLWYARSAEFMGTPLIETLRWLRIVGDVIFMAGVGSLAWWTIGLKTGHAFRDTKKATREVEPIGSAI